MSSKRKIGYSTLRAGQRGRFSSLSSTKVAVSEAQTVQIDGRPHTIGDAVGFKSDVEQAGVIVGIKSDRYRGPVLVLKPAGDDFHGEYIRGCATTEMDASDCWSV